MPGTAGRRLRRCSGSRIFEPAHGSSARPVWAGHPRKALRGGLGVPGGGAPRPPAERGVATAATTVIAGLAGVWAVRVHDVASSVEALQVVAAMEAAR